MTVSKDSHHFSRTLGSLWWQSFKTAITSAELWAVFDGNLSRQPSLQQNFGQSLMTVFNDNVFLERPPRGRFRERCPKFCWSDGCLWRLSSNTAQSSAEVMAVLKDCHQRLPKVLLKWWLSQRLPSKTAQSSAEVMAVLKDCHQRLLKVLLMWWLSFRDCHQKLPKVLLKWWLSLKTVIKDCPKFCWDCPKFCWSDGCL